MSARESSTHAEEWTDVPGFPGYRVSNLGRVRGRRGWILKTYPAGSSTYPSFTACVPGRERRRIPVHRAVLFAFVGVPPEGHECNHINGNKLDNRLDNLEWVTRSENALHRTRVLKKQSGPNHYMAGRTHCPNGHLYTESSADPDGGNSCRECIRERQRRYYLNGGREKRDERRRRARREGRPVH